MNKPARDYTGLGFNELMQRDMVDPASIGLQRDQLVSQDKQSFNIADVRNFRIFMQGTVTRNQGDTSVEVVHNLGYAPAYIAFAKGTLGRWFLLPFVQQSISDNPTLIPKSTKTKLIFEGDVYPTDQEIAYFIFREKA